MNENIKTFFDSIAISYKHDDSKLIDELLSSLYLKDSKRVLDLGCGKGIISEKLVNLTKGEVVALDLSSEMIKYAKENVKSDKVTFINGDFYELDGYKFDAIICFDAFPHFIDVDGFVKKAYELLNEDGELAILHDIPRSALNEHHKQHALKVSRKLSDPITESEAFKNYFTPIELTETDTYYKMIYIKRD